MSQVARKACLERHGSDRRILPGEELEVGNIAAPEPAFAKRFRKPMPVEVQPAMRVDPRTVLQGSDRLTAVAEDTLHRSQAGCTCPGADSHSDGIKPPESRQVPINHG